LASFSAYACGVVFGKLYPDPQFNLIMGESLVTIKAPSIYNLLTNNLGLIFIMVAGSFCFSAITIKNLFLNGYITGSVLSTNLKLMLALFVPHAILEIPAIIIAGAAGFKIPYEILRYLAGKKEQILTQEDIREYLTLALISVILVVIAAWIEANITLEIAKAMLSSTKSI
jgi:uncharacterized membrane protein SpoIIM required for sporulation